MRREEMNKFEKKLVLTYTDALGVKRRIGKKKELRESQRLGSIKHQGPPLAIRPKQPNPCLPPCCFAQDLHPGVRRVPHVSLSRAVAGEDLTWGCGI